ncbi:hypothetical protein [Paenibacillus darwinianus]|nr:hypothetical protein [Paenibacillus darwinianus]EXX84633.1 hypothetical protein CH50_11345 [Paenibacillus darwinianus]EXX84767.1 hypothetical protein BG52_09915 [Paenibacillus darwinianus]
MFLIIGTAALFGVFGKGGSNPALPVSIGQYVPHGAIGLWASLLFAFYTFGGIEIMGMKALRLRNPRDAPKTGKMMLLLAIVYSASLLLAITLVPWTTFQPG